MSTTDRPIELTEEQKRDFYRDGFIVLRNIVPQELVHAARRHANITAGKILNGTMDAPRRRNRFVGGEEVITDLINKSPLKDILTNTMGPFDPPTRGFSPVLFPREPSREIGNHGLPDDEVPNHAFFPHIDGQWSGPVPKHPDEVDDWNAPKTDHFGDRSANVLGANSSPLFQDPACTLSLGSFTTFVGVVLSDQSQFGYGNISVLRGAHHYTRQFFCQQRDAGGIIGPEGHGWPRLKPVGDNSVGLNTLPQWIADHYKEGAEYTPDGLMWLEPTPVLAEPGDAFITVHGIPHCGTRNDLGADPRISGYFRIRRHRPSGATVIGDSDHPDRGYDGEFLDYPEGYDPFQVSKDKLCDPWSEWDGMQEIVKEMEN